MRNGFEARDGWIGGAIFLAVAGLYWRTVGFAFVNVDDPLNVTANEIVQRGLTGEGLRYAFSSVADGNYIPLTWLSHMAVCEARGLDPAGHHAANVVLHALGSALLFAFLAPTTGARGCSALVALLFALHPLRTESVAWVSERKDVLSGVFWMAALLAYAFYARRPGPGRYLLVGLALGLGLLAKPSLITLPFVLLLMDFWPLRRLDFDGPGAGRRLARLALEKLPLLAIGAASGAAAVVAQRSVGALTGVGDVSLAQRLWNVPASYAMYLWQTFWPWPLGVYYPYPDSQTLYLRGGMGAAAIAVLSVTAWALRRRAPAALVGWLWFLGVLVPMIGLVQVGGQGHADRYTYLAQIGLWIAVVWLAAEALERGGVARSARTALAAATLLVAAVLMWRQLGHWRNSEALFSRTLAITGPNRFAEGNYAAALMEQGRYEEAEIHFRRAAEIGAGFASDQRNLGLALLNLGRAGDALGPLDVALALNPEESLARALRGRALLSLGRGAEAAAEFRRLIDSSEEASGLKTNLAIALAMSGEEREAEAVFVEVLAASPNDVSALYNYGLLLVKRGDAAGAEAQLRRAIALDFTRSDAHYYLAAALAQQGRAAEALEELGWAVARDGRLAERARTDPLLAGIRGEEGFDAVAEPR